MSDPAAAGSLDHAAAAEHAAQQATDSSARIGGPERLALLPPHRVLRALESSLRGLTEQEAEERALAHGENALVAVAGTPRAVRLWAAARGPFVFLLAGLALVAAVTGNPAGAGVIAAMAVTSCWLRVAQEIRGERAAAALRALVGVSASVSRRAEPDAAPVDREVAIAQLVPGDLVRLHPGDLVSADLYLLRAADLTVSEGALTGESRLAVKSAPPTTGPDLSTAERPWLCAAGGRVAHGTGTGIVIATGPDTTLGGAHSALAGVTPTTAYDRAVSRVTRLLLLSSVLVAAAVLALLAVAHGAHAQALVFALAVAVGLTPEMLPVVTTGVLFTAARSMARRGTVVRRLAAVHNLGAMDTLCVDKTGTLTEDRPAVVDSLDPTGVADPGPLTWARAVSAAVAAHTPGLIDAFDDALLACEDVSTDEFDVLDVLPFDPERRRASALLRQPGRLGSALLVTHGAVPEILDACDAVLRRGQPEPISAEQHARLTQVAQEQADQGVRLLAVASRQLPPRPRSRPLRPADEHALVLVGFVALRDRPRAEAAAALARLADLGVDTKVITGDVPRVAAAVCAELGFDPGRIATGAQVEACDQAQLARLVQSTRVFARTAPAQKARIVAALQDAGRVTGFLGDGVNDAPALRAADVALALSDGADLARDCADVVLGPAGLADLPDAVAAGRRAVANTAKYLKITISSNAGNALSMLFAALLLPFLPMLPLQILVQNLAFDLAQLALGGDRVEPAAAARPRDLSLRDLCRFTVLFAPLNTLADLATFRALGATLGPLGVGAQAAFHAGWFIENLLTQVCAIYLLRTRRARRWRERASGPLLAAMASLAALALVLPLSPLAVPLGLVAPPAAFYPWLAAIVAGYCVLTVTAKAAYVRGFGRIP